MHEDGTCWQAYMTVSNWRLDNIPSRIVAFGRCILYVSSGKGVDASVLVSVTGSV